MSHVSLVIAGVIHLPTSIFLDVYTIFLPTSHPLTSLPDPSIHPSSHGTYCTTLILPTPTYPKKKTLPKSDSKLPVSTKPHHHPYILAQPLLTSELPNPKTSINTVSTPLLCYTIRKEREYLERRSSDATKREVDRGAQGIRVYTVQCSYDFDSGKAAL